MAFSSKSTPDGFDEISITEMIDPEKDVDGFHPVNLGRIVTGKVDGLLPCTPLLSSTC